MKIGFIGLGNMGNPSAANLIKAGFDLTVHDLHRRAAENLLTLGAHWADSPRDCAAGVDVLICSLPGPPQSKAVMLSEDGALAELRPGSTWIDLTTNDPALVKHVAALAAEKDVATLEAPVTNAIDGARTGTMTIFVGGDAEVLERHAGVFAPLGKTIHMGALGIGNATKLITNMLWFIHAAAIGEGLVLGAKAGVPLETLWEAIKGSAGDSWVARHDVPSIFRGDYDPSFTLDLCVKDLRLINGLGYQFDVPLELTTHVEQIFRRAQQQYGGSQGEMHVVKLLEDVTETRLQLPGYD